MKLVDAEIIINKQLKGSTDFYMLELYAPDIAAQAVPGQFVMLTPDPGESPYLKRPMGINAIDKKNGTIRVIYQIKGKGTKAMSKLAEHQHMAVLGPLGHGWRIVDSASRICMVGGGSGIATLQPLAKALHELGITDIDYIFGGKGKEQLICLEDFERLGNILPATEDGSFGRKGMVDVYFDKAPDYDLIYSCGPVPMMRRAAQWAAEADVPCQVSLEERMGCGYGVCVGCVCETKSTDNKVSYKRVCKEGPVFDAKEVFFND